MEEIKIEDESGDKKYFTIIPNYIYNHSTLYDREVYCQMKRIAGDNGTCWMSQKNLAEQCGISINRLKKSIKYLTDHRWIKFNGKKIIKTQGGTQEVNEYSISDLWKMNNDFYHKGVSPDDTPQPKGVSPDDARGITKEPQGVSPDDDKEEPINNNNKEKHIIGDLESMRLTDLLYKLVKENYPFIKEKDYSGDYAEMEKIKRLDGWDYEQIEFIIDWSQRHSFWKQNIRSVSKLRKQFENLVVRAKENNNQVIKT